MQSELIRLIMTQNGITRSEFFFIYLYLQVWHGASSFHMLWILLTFFQGLLHLLFSALCTTHPWLYDFVTVTLSFPCLHNTYLSWALNIIPGHSSFSYFTGTSALFKQEKSLRNSGRGNYLQFLNQLGIYYAVNCEMIFAIMALSVHILHSSF